MAIQKRNDELVDLLAADFQRRYEPQFAWANVCSMFQLLPGLRGFWPMSAVSATPAVIDLSGNLRTLTYNGDPIFGLDLTTARSLAPYIRFDGTGDYLSRADEGGLDITGTETYFASQATTAGAARGLTLGGWFYPEDNASQEGLITKWSAAAGNYSYGLWTRGDVANDPVRFEISDDGTNSDSADSGAYSVDTWQFMAGRFNDADTGAELAVWLNGTKTTAATARASIFSGNADLYVGSDMPGNTYEGRASLCFLCGAALPDVVLFALYHQTRALFGV